ncbi:MAG TPA: hypothetical protein PLB59_06905 [Bacteroidales bacterium]|nr:hypothetical protein [Bacteroidales bacterium]HNX07884.1 hypothetical protein [Bacteroidales bacterium]HPB25428.1 hypothetical protein [Bacteroidales bacterium]HPS27489.1 hypothetical protein [Bacteroidales bacterium]HQN16103.1 hypothetical protein [Bacteroidales bacterium]
MEDFSALVSGIEFKTHQLIKRLKELTKDNVELKKQLAVLTREEEENKAKIKYLEDKNKILRIAKTIEGDDKTKAKLRINELLREVDRCIAQLNK